MIELHKLSAPCKLKIMIVVEINYYARTGGEKLCSSSARPTRVEATRSVAFRVGAT